MDFYDVIRARRSVRSYQSTPVPQSVVEHIAEAVNLAPTACNRQPFRVLFVTDPAKRAALCDSNRFAWLADAPAIAVVVGNSAAAWKRLEGDSIVDVDCAIIMEHLILAATAEGLGTCWICAFQRDIANAALNLPEGESAVAMTPVGYAADGFKPVPLTRKPLAQVFEVI
ncbi:MAG: nitroreductase family protein [Victivallales bacterium]|nr:nitroreductase family protein [Victivallales bacterium]